MSNKLLKNKKNELLKQLKELDTNGVIKNDITIKKFSKENIIIKISFYFYITITDKLQVYQTKNLIYDSNASGYDVIFKKNLIYFISIYLEKNIKAIEKILIDTKKYLQNN